MSDFCKKFNDSTKDYVKDTPIPVTLSAFSNRTFTYEVKTPPTSWLLKKCAGVTKGSGRPTHDYIGEVHVKQIYEIAKIKQSDEHMKDIPLESIARSVLGSAHSMGIRIVNEVETKTDYTAVRAKNEENKRAKGGTGKKKK